MVDLGAIYSEEELRVLKQRIGRGGLKVLQQELTRQEARGLSGEQLSQAASPIIQEVAFRQFKRARETDVGTPYERALAEQQAAKEKGVYVPIGDKPGQIQVQPIESSKQAYVQTIETLKAKGREFTPAEMREAQKIEQQVQAERKAGQIAVTTYRDYTPSELEAQRQSVVWKKEPILSEQKISTIGEIRAYKEKTPFEITQETLFKSAEAPIKERPRIVAGGLSQLYRLGTKVQTLKQMYAEHKPNIPAFQPIVTEKAPILQEVGRAITATAYGAGVFLKGHPIEFAAFAASGGAYEVGTGGFRYLTARLATKLPRLAPALETTSLLVTEQVPKVLTVGAIAGAGLQIVTAPTFEKKAEVVGRLGVETGAFLAGARAAAPVAEKFELKAQLEETIAKLPKKKQEAFRELLKRAEQLAEAKAPPKPIITELRKVELLKGETPDITQQVLLRYKDTDLVVGGSLSQKLQLRNIKELELRPTGDVDVYTDQHKQFISELASRYKEAGIEDVRTQFGKESSKIFIKGEKVVEAHSKEFLEKNIKQVQGLFETVKSGVAVTPEGIKVLELGVQIKRKAIGGFLPGERPKGIEEKDVKDFIKLAEGLRRRAIKKAEEKVLFPETRVKAVEQKFSELLGAVKIARKAKTPRLEDILPKPKKEKKLKITIPTFERKAKQRKQRKFIGGTLKIKEIPPRTAPPSVLRAKEVKAEGLYKPFVSKQPERIKGYKPKGYKAEYKAPKIREYKYKPYTPSKYKAPKPITYKPIEYKPYKPIEYKPYKPTSYIPSRITPYKEPPYKPFKVSPPYKAPPYTPPRTPPYKYPPYKTPPYTPPRTPPPDTPPPDTPPPTRKILFPKPPTLEFVSIKKKPIRRPQPRKYVYSLEAKVFQIRGKRQKGLLTGFGIRPLPLLKRRK